MARFKVGKAAAEAAAVRPTGGAFTPSHKFEAGETKYLQFLTSIDELATVEMHRFIIVGEREDGSDKFADFIVGEDEETGEKAYDPIKDRFGIKPVRRNIALAVELQPIWDKQGTKRVLGGWDLVYREYKDAEGTEHSVPNVALVNESPYTFYGHLLAYDDLEPIENVVFAIKRTGKTTDTSYTLMKAGDAIEGLAEDEDVAKFFEEFDFVEYLEGLSSDERMAELIDPLPDDAILSRYQNKGKKGKKDEAKTSSSTRTRRAAAAEEPAEAVEPEAGEEPAEETAQPAARSRRFQNLKSDMS